MTYCYRFFLFSLFLTSHIAGAQRLKKADKEIISQLARHQDYLSVKDAAASGKRLTEYICREFKSSGITPKGEKGSYYRSYTVPDGVESATRSFLSINGDTIRHGDYIPLLMSPGIALEASAFLALLEAGQPWFLDLSEQREQEQQAVNSGEPVPDTLVNAVHRAGNATTAKAGDAELAAYILSKAASARQKGATALFIYNTRAGQTAVAYDCYASGDSLPLPVIYIRPAIARKYFMDKTVMVAIQLKVAFTEKTRREQYVAGLIDNNAAATVAIGARENIDDAGALIELGKLLKKIKRPASNYLLVTMHGEERPGAGKAGLAPLTVDYVIDTHHLNGPDKLHYLRSMVEKVK